MKIHHRQKTSVDLGLAVIEALAIKNEIKNVTLTAKDIADICECSHQRIHQIECSAKSKVAQRISPEWVQL